MKYVLYHANCYDGFGSAYSAWKELGNSAQYIPVGYGKPLPDMPDATHVYILDFSYPLADVYNLTDQGVNVVILDHHKTAQENLGILGQGQHPTLPLFVNFDMTKSGALLAWEYFNPETPVPLIIQYIADRDLWKFELEGSARFHKALSSYPMDFELWDSLDEATLLDEGIICERMHAQIVTDVCKHAFWVTIDGHTVPAVNNCVGVSEVCHKLIDMYPEAPFVACFSITPERTVWSLRSKAPFDVSAIASKFGGGGHAQASGFKTSHTYALQFMAVDSGGN